MFKDLNENTKIKTRELIDKLKRNSVLLREEYEFLIDNIDLELFEYLKKQSDEVRKENYGNKVFLRGLIEFSNYCKQGCYYCGISRENHEIPRYRLSIEDIMKCADQGYKLGFRTFVLQSGEDPHFTDDIICDIIRTIKNKYPDTRITLSIGEKSEESYLCFYEAGCDRYLLRHEAANEELYRSIHPSEMSLSNRKECLRTLKKIGFQTGAGFMVGLPNQTTGNLVDDILFLKSLNPEMVGIGPFIPHSKTRLKDEKGGTLDKVLLMLALVRLTLPKALLPATTALGTLNKIGREMAIQAGANVVMPNLSPVEKKKDYQLYEDKICLEDTSEECRNCMEMKLKFYGYEVDMSVGDHPNFSETFINEKEITGLLEQKITSHELDEILSKARKLEGISDLEVAKLLSVEDDNDLEKIFEVSKYIKDSLYGNRIVLFAPLYISNHCKNNCRYCGFKRDNKFERKALSMNEIIEEAKALEGIGHKRIALEVGEDIDNSGIDYVCEAIRTIYASSDLRRINVNVAATTVENYRKLEKENIGTYLLFQETYHEKTYKYEHLGGLKANYKRQLYAHHNAMEAGIEDVGGGVLFGLYDYKYEVISMIRHNHELENKFGVGFHTVSVPRLKSAMGNELKEYPYIIDDFTFKKIVAILRIALPKVGIILSTRETEEMREELIDHGVSQISAASKTDVGGYSQEKVAHQFELSDERSLKDVIKGIIKKGLVPSYCTACYRQGRTGEEFMKLVGAGRIKEFCHVNSILTLSEYIETEKDDELTNIGYELIKKELSNVSENLRKKAYEKIESIKNGEKDQYV